MKNQAILADSAGNAPGAGMSTSELRSLACSKCGATMACGAQADRCWCQAFPSLPAAAVDPMQDCMCASCLIRAHSDFELNQKTMPKGALGDIGELAKQIARIQRTLKPKVESTAIIVFAADHGVTEEGVSAYPKEVTWQMVENFRGGGAAINVLTRAQGIALIVVDAGVDHDFADDSAHAETHSGSWAPSAEVAKTNLFLNQKIGLGTANFARGPAMSTEQALACINKGRAVASRAIQTHATQALGFGEMGIGNTTSAAALICKLLKLSPQDVVGRGTGIDDQQLRHKQEVVTRALALHEKSQSPLEVLASLGGFEIGQMAGAMMEAAKLGQVLVIDGFITSAALLLAMAIEAQEIEEREIDPRENDEPRSAAKKLEGKKLEALEIGAKNMGAEVNRLQWRAAPYAKAGLLGSCVFAHQSEETGHALVLQALGVKPLLNLGLRLGEGSGAALAMPLLKSAAVVLSCRVCSETPGRCRLKPWSK
jgi:nicotinate-nucleotide--dimethylbenzimidazole phosphoribosyltransferase